MSKTKSITFAKAVKTKSVLPSSVTIKEDEEDLEARTESNLISAEELPKKPRHHHKKYEIISLFTMAMMEHIIQSWEMIPDEEIIEEAEETEQEEEEDISIRRGGSSLRKLSQRMSVAPGSVLSKIMEATAEASPSIMAKRVSTVAARQRTASHIKRGSTIGSESGVELKHGDSQGTKLFGSEVLEEVQEEVEEEHSSQEVSVCSITEISDESPWPKDGNVVIVFTNGIVYEGHIKQSLMDGEGLMLWPDGSLYEGEFTAGQITGKGYIEWPDLSWYEGDVCLGYRHGLGMYRATFADVTYSGNWYMGCKEGPGLLFYSENLNNYYNGEWVQNERHGLGMRAYPSLAYYYGNWVNGLQHGVGTMIWSNNDLYQGSWQKGKMSGYGEYTWSAFLNVNFVLPAENRYCGEWKTGERCGNGILNLRNGTYIKGQWKNGHKDGPGVIVYPNGSSINGDPLFINDHLIKHESSEAILQDSHSSDCAVSPLRHGSRQNTNSHGAIRNTSKTKYSRYKQVGTEIKPRNIVPNSKLITQSCANKLTSAQNVKSLEEVRNTAYNIKCIEVSYHLSRWIKFRYPEFRFVVKDDIISEEIERQSSHTSTTDEKKMSLDDTSQHCESKNEEILKNGKNIEIMKEIDNEKKWLYDALIYHLPYMKELYTKYACMFSEEDITYQPILFRLLLWQLLRDCDVHKHISLIELDILFAENSSCLFESVHDPFEPIQMWQFQHILLDLSWVLYTSKGNKEECDYGEIASGFQKLLINDIKPNTLQLNGIPRLLAGSSSLQNNNQNGNFKDEPLKYIHVLPLEPIYLLYRSIGEAHTARDLLNYICGSSDWKNSNIKSIASLLALNGKNIFCNGNLVYLPNNKMIDFSTHITDMSPVAPTFEENTEYESFSSITPEILVTCMALLCPQIQPIEELICNMDYKLTFLEFYEVLVASALAIPRDEKDDKKCSSPEDNTLVVESRSNHLTGV